MTSSKQFLSNYLCSIIKPSVEELEAFLKIVTFLDVPKGKRLIQANGISDQIYFVIEGFLKYLMKINAKDYVVHIAGQSDLVTDFYGYFAAKPATTSIYTITDCKLACAKKKDLEALYASFHKWEKFGRLVAEQAAVRQIQEKIKLQTKSTEEIYLDLISLQPELFKHVKLGDLAQSLGVTQETLSRIRRRILG